MTAEQETRHVDLFKNPKILFHKAKIVGHRDLPGTTPKECPCLDVGSWAARHHLDLLFYLYHLTHAHLIHDLAPQVLGHGDGRGYAEFILLAN